MKVALISFHNFYQPGGVKRHILGLAKEFKKRDIGYKIIVPRRKLNEDYGKDVILLGTSFPLPFGGSMADFDINFNPLAIERVLRREKFNILHLHNFGFPSAIQILTSHSVSNTFNTLNILTFHSNIEGSRLLKIFPQILKLLNQICQWKIDGIIGVAPFVLEYFKEYYGPKIVIPNGIDLEKFNPKVKKLRKFSNDKINILFLGRIEERKGLIYLLKAYKILTKRFSNLRLVIVGEGPLKENLETWVLKNKLKNVIFEGKVNEEKVPSYYTSCDIFCAPSIFGESFGLVLVEAMACGKPVVAFANQGYKNVLTGKGANFLVKPRDYKTLAKKLEILIKNKKLREKMGKWGIQEAKKYSWERVAERVLSFYQFCLKEKRKRKKGFSLEKSVDRIINKFYNKIVLNRLK